MLSRLLTYGRLLHWVRMQRCVTVAVSIELLELTNIENRLNQFKSSSGIQCDIVKISDQDAAYRIKQDLTKCEVALITPGYFPKIGKCIPPSLNWIQSAWAGVEQLTTLHPDVRDRLQQCTITRGATAFGTMMAEYTICAIIYMERDMPKIFRQKVDRIWSWEDVSGFRSLHEISIGILGVGEIGKEVARLCSCMGMTVYGMKTSLDPVQYVDKIYTSDQLTELLQASNYVCNILPSTPKTKGLLSNGVLKACKNDPIKFINIGRGDVIDERSLVEALNNGWINHAFLDVYEKEPLPAESPLWSLENVTMTPHASCASIRETVPNAFIENLENYINGKGLRNKFKWDKQY